MADSSSVGLVINQAMLSTMIAYVIEFAKRTKWFPWLKAETAKLNRMVAVVISGAAAIGIHATYNHEGGVLMITGLSAWTIIHGLWDWLRSFIFTQAAYDGLIAPNQKLDKTVDAVVTKAQGESGK